MVPGARVNSLQDGLVLVDRSLKHKRFFVALAQQIVLCGALRELLIQYIGLKSTLFDNHHIALGQIHGGRLLGDQGRRINFWLTFGRRHR